MIQRLRSNLYVLFLMSGVLASLGCGTVETPVNMVLDQPTVISVEMPIVTPPYNLESTNLVGGMQMTITTQLGLFELLGMFVGQAIPSDIAVDDILIAGTEIVISDVLPLGTLCIAPDPLDPSGGTAYLNPMLEVAEYDMMLNMVLHVTNPMANNLLGDPLAFPMEVNTIAPLTFGDMIEMMGGGTGNIALSQDVDAELGPVPFIGPIIVTGTLNLSSADAQPTDPLLDECAAYLADL